MSEVIGNTVKLIKLLQAHQRVTIRKAQLETGLSQRSIYRYVDRMADVLPVRIEFGVIILLKEEKPI